MLAPVVLFVYNRLWHTQQTVAALERNHGALQSDLIIYSDGPKSKTDFEQITAVREYLETISQFKSVSIIKSEDNKGLAKSIIDGVTQVLQKYETIVVLEDDMITSPFFLSYMNEALDLYRNDEKVISIHGYMYPVKSKLPETFFLRGSDCWGWATWRRGWQLFEPDGTWLLKELEKRELAYEFDFNGSYPYVKMLKGQIKGTNNSWAIRWYASAFLEDRLTLYPGTSLVNNIGHDGSGVHSLKSNQNEYATEVASKKIELKKLEPVEDKIAKRAIANFHKNQQSIRNMIVRKIKSLINR